MHALTSKTADQSSEHRTSSIFRLSREASRASVPSAQVVHDVGVPLPSQTRDASERHLGGDLSTVRIHQGSHVARLGAIAYAQGDAIHFAPGEYRPGTLDGDRLLGHELVHVAQQRAGRVRGLEQAGAVAPVVDDPQLEAEANAWASRVVGGEQATPFGLGEASSFQPANAPIQRQPAHKNTQTKEIVDAGEVFVGDGVHKPTDVSYARRVGKADAADLGKIGVLTDEDKTDLNAKLKFFKGDAHDVYLSEIKAALLDVAGPTTTRERARTGHQLDVHTFLDGIRELKKDRIEEWRKAADKPEPNAAQEALALVIAVASEGLGGVAYGLIEKIMHDDKKILTEFVGLAGLEAADLAAEAAFRKALDYNRDALKKGTENALKSKEDTAKAALATQGNIRDAYAEAMRLEAIQEFVDQSTAFNKQSANLTDQELINRAAGLKITYEQLKLEPVPLLQQLTIGFIRLLEEATLAEDVSSYGGDKNKMWHEDEELHNATPWLEGGDLEVFPWPRRTSIGKWTNPDIDLTFNITGNGVNTDTLNRLRKMKVENLGVTLAFHFRVDDPYHRIVKGDMGLSEVGFVRDTNGGCYIDDRMTDDDGKEWLASYYTGRGEEHSDQDRNLYAPLGARKFYEATKHGFVVAVNEDY